mgnify:CR=1 FL=1|eukprot:symbB.v1.2.006321.t1/scaffold354.1/size221495/16
MEDEEGGSANLAADVDTDSYEVLSTHPFCRALRKEVILAISRASKRWVFTTSGRIIVQEGTVKAEHSSLWIVTRGSVEVAESGQLLALLETGAIFGDSVAFGRCDQQPFSVKACEVPLVAWCLPAAELQQVLKLHPAAANIMDEFVDQQEKRVIWPRASKINLLSHTGPNFTKQLLKKVVVKHFRASSTVWSPYNTTTSMRVVITGKVLVQKNTRADFELKSCLSISPQKERRKTVHIGEPDQVEVEDRSQMARRLSDPEASSPTLLAREHFLSMASSSSNFTKSMSFADQDLPDSGDEDSDEESGFGYEEDSEEDSALSSSDSSNSSDEANVYELPETLAHLEPSNQVQAKAGPYCLVFNEASLIGYEMNDEEQFRTITALTDCMVCDISKESFQEAIVRAPREKKRFNLLAAARYKEWERCGIHKLANLEVLSKCSKEFLSDFAQHAVPAICFHGSDMMEDVNDGLVLLMGGHADRISVDHKRYKIQAPEILSKIHWLGESTDVAMKVKAKEACQVLHLDRSKLLDLLSQHPHQTAVIVAEATRLNARKTASRNKGGRGAGGQNQLFWYCPFCENLGATFLSELIRSMECFKLIPGQHLFRSLQGPSADLMVVLTKGKIRAGEKCLEAPRVICGFDRSGYMDTVAEVLSDVYCMNFERCSQLAKSCPEETRAFLTRVQRFQERLEFRQGRQWWSAGHVLRRHEPFAACPDNFLSACSGLIRVRFVLPEEIIVEEGDFVENALIIEMGSARVHRQTRPGLRGCPDRTGEVQDSYLVGGISGAFSFAGMQLRLATIKALTVCKIVEVKVSGILALLDQYQDACQNFREIAEKRFKELAPEPLEEHPFFKGFSKSFLNTLRTKCNSQVFFTGETIIKQGDAADSMIIISPASVVTIFVDDRKLKDLSGGCTLGVPSILEAKPGKRFATIVAQNACAVQKLSRKDWLDALKNHAEHRQWIQEFTTEQLGIANKQAQETTRKYRWRKIKERETHAVSLHCQRNGRPAVTKTDKNGPEMEPPMKESMERWECFNGQEAVMPHTRLPQLSLVKELVKEDRKEVAQPRSAMRRISDVAKSLKLASLTRPTDRRSVLGEVPEYYQGMPTLSHGSWLDCQDAFGLLNHPLANDHSP